MLCHCARAPYSDETWGPSLEALLTAKEKGLIKAVGVSAHSVEGVRVAARHPDIEVIHPLINLTGMGITDGVGIHGTGDDYSIGSAASHGCIRMHVPDVKRLYPLVPVGTTILIR